MCIRDRLKLVEREQQKTLSQALLLAAQPLFVEEHRALLQQLCVELEYVEDDILEALGEVRVDVVMDPLELFKASYSVPDRSRFQLLFEDTQSAERDKLRLLFFSNSKQNPAAQSGSQILEVFSSARDKLMTDERHGAAMVLSDVRDAIQISITEPCFLVIQTSYPMR